MPSFRLRRAGLHLVVLSYASENLASLEAGLAALRRDWSRLAARIKTIEHEVVVEGCRTTLRLHHPTLRESAATTAELVRAITLFIPSFCLPRRELDVLHANDRNLDPFDLHIETTRLDRRAYDLFMRANAAGGRSGEAGELLLYLLTEWVLEAPQMLAKMSLKTSSEMPVHGSDGIHVKVIPETGKLLLYSGEAKLHASLASAIRSAVASIREAMSPSRLERELELVRRDLDISGLDERARQALLAFLDPFDPTSENRIDVITCLLGFDFAPYANPLLDGEPDTEFRRRALAELPAIAASVAAALSTNGLGGRTIELFLFPLPSVAEFRRDFQDHIGVSRR